MLMNIAVLISLIVCAAVLYIAMDRFWDILYPVPQSTMPETESSGQKIRIAVDNPMFASMFADAPQQEECELLSGSSSEILTEMERRRIDVAVLSDASSSLTDDDFTQISAVCRMDRISFSSGTVKVVPLSKNNTPVRIIYRTTLSPFVRSLFDSGILIR